MKKLGKVLLMILAVVAAVLVLLFAGFLFL